MLTYTLSLQIGERAPVTVTFDSTREMPEREVWYLMGLLQDIAGRAACFGVNHLQEHEAELEAEQALEQAIEAAKELASQVPAVEPLLSKMRAARRAQRVRREVLTRSIDLFIAQPLPTSQEPTSAQQ